MTTVIKPPAALPAVILGASVFLAGTIDMGNSVDWQTSFTDSLGDLDVTILNPRRDSWDSSWEQDISNPRFREQVEWELDGLKKADIILMHFEPSSKSPITLAELGMFCNSGRLFVSCPPGYWRRGNVQVICDRHDVPLFDSFEEASLHVRSLLTPLKPFNLHRMVADVDVQ